MECYKYNNYGHITKLCRSKAINSSKSDKKNLIRIKIKINEKNAKIKKACKKNDNNATGSLICQFSLKAKNKIRLWIIDSGCTKHITRDK